MDTKYRTLRTEVYANAVCAGFNTGQSFVSWEANRHCNAEYELHFLVRGSCTLLVKDTSLSLTAPAAVIISPGIHHMPGTKSEDFLHFNISFSPLSKDGRELLSSLREYVIPVVSEDQRFLCERLIRECEGHLPCREEMIDAMLSELFIGILRDCEGFRNKSLDTPLKEQNQSEITEKYRTDIIDNFFENRHSEEVDETMLAKELHVSPRHLNRILQKNYGLSFREKLLGARMDHAAWLLKTSSLSITEVSNAVGYPSEGSLFRHFKAYFHMTPGQYRKNDTGN